MKMLSFSMSTKFSLRTRAHGARITQSLLRLILISLIGFWTPFVQATEPSFDVLSHLLHAYAGPVDEKAAQAAPETDVPPESGARLAAIQADLSLLAEGFEAFRHPSHSQHALQDMPDHIVPELRPFFKDRDSTLDAVYRTLAVMDYTWALRFPEPTCDPRTRRKILLSSKDGLFTDPKSGDLSPWLARLLGPAAYGHTAEEALDRASSKQGLSARDYELLRVKVAKITEALRSDKAVGKERAKLYCLRADAYETLASAHQAAMGGPIQASRATGAKNLPDTGGDSVLLVAVMEGADQFRAVGAGILAQTAHGRKVLTDAGLLPAGAEANPTLYGFIRTKEGTLDRPRVITVERTDQTTGVMVGSIQGAEGIPALKISQGSVARQDLVRAIGHMSAGTWTVGQGLVTATGNGTFASDAILGPDMRGGPLLNDMGEVLGLVVLSPQGDPAAIMPERLRALADGDAPVTASADIQFIESRQTGSGAVLTASNPNYIYTPTPYGTVRGRCLNCDDAPQSSYSPGSSGGAEIGQALGQAMAPLVEALIFKGVPALFRGIGSLFKSKPRASPPQIVQSKPAVVVQEKPPEPPRINCSLVKTDVPAKVGVDTVELRVRFSCDDQASDRKVPLAGHKVTFTLGWEGKKPQYEKLETTTDAQGYASIAFYLQNPKANAERSFEDLDKYDPGGKPSAQANAPAGELIDAARPGKALALVGQAATVRSVARLTLGNASIAAGGTVGEIAVTGAASIGIIVAGGAAVVFTVKSGLDDMIAAQDKYNAAIDTNKPMQGKFDALDKEAAESREDEEDCSLKPGEDITARFLDGTRLAAGFLRLHENHGGHTIERHVGKPLKYLIGRLSEIRDASSYNDLLTAENVTRRTIISARQEIETWLARAIDVNLAVRNPGGPELAAIGYAVSRGNYTPTPKYDAAVFLQKAPQCRILIRTSYPE